MVQSPEGRGSRAWERGRQAEQIRDWRIEEEEGRRSSQGVRSGVGLVEDGWALSPLAHLVPES